MSKSSAKKKREKQIREGKRDPEKNRGIYALADMRTRKTKTKRELLNKRKYKSRFSSIYDENTDFFIYIPLWLTHRL